MVVPGTLMLTAADMAAPAPPPPKGSAPAGDFGLLLDARRDAPDQPEHPEATTGAERSIHRESSSRPDRSPSASSRPERSGVEGSVPPPPTTGPDDQVETTTGAPARDEATEAAALLALLALLGIVPPPPAPSDETSTAAALSPVSAIDGVDGDSAPGNPLTELASDAIDDGPEAALAQMIGDHEAADDTPAEARPPAALAITGTADGEAEAPDMATAARAATHTTPMPDSEDVQARAPDPPLAPAATDAPETDAPAPARPGPAPTADLTVVAASSAPPAAATGEVAAPPAPNGVETLERVLEQTQAAIRGGQSSVRIRLEPESLGAVDLRIVARNGLLDIRLTAVNPETGEVLRGGLDQLRHGLVESGHQIQRLRVETQVAQPAAAEQRFGDLMQQPGERGPADERAGADWRRSFRLPGPIPNDADGTGEPAVPTTTAVPNGVDYRI